MLIGWLMVTRVRETPLIDTAYKHRHGGNNIVSVSKTYTVNLSHV